MELRCLRGGGGLRRRRWRESSMQGCERWMAGGGKAEAVVGVAVEQPADGAVAKAALAVEDDEETVAELGRIFH